REAHTRGPGELVNSPLRVSKWRCSMRGAVIVLAGIGLLVGGLPAAAQSSTYGATVTLEEGVRVFRPLPLHASAQASPDSAQPDACACKPTYLHRVGETAASGRYLRRVLETEPLRGPR